MDRVHWTGLWTKSKRCIPRTGPIMLLYNTVRPLLSGHLLSGHPPLSGHFPKSRFIIIYLLLPLLSGQPLLSGHFSKSQGWPLNRGRTVFCFLKQPTDVCTCCRVYVYVLLPRTYAKECSPNFQSVHCLGLLF